MNLLRVVRQGLTILLLVGATSLWLPGQTGPAQLTGFVTDPSGSAVPGAEVTLTSALTGVKVRVPTNNLGLYTIIDIEPGTYQLQVQKSGFETMVRPDIRLSVGQVARVDLQLKVGQVSESVEVSGAPPLLQATEASVGGSLENTKIVNLPLNGRDPYQFIALLPGIQPQSSSSGSFYQPRVLIETMYQTFFTVNGGPPYTNEIMIDGTPNTVEVHGQLAYTPSQDAVQEFRTLTSTYSAEYGRTGGAAILIATKSGTNDFHGTVYEYLRNSALDSNNFFNNQNGLTNPPFRFNMYGGTIGGPVWLPHMYNGHDKTFFFFGFEGQKVRQAVSDLTTVPTSSQRAGNYSQTFNAQGRLVTIYDPITTVETAAGSYVRTPFPGDQIPANRLDPVALRASTFFPLPNVPGLPFTQANNYATTAAQANNFNTYQGRVDHYFGEHDHLFARYSQDKMTNLPANFFHDIATSNSYGPATEPDYLATVVDTHTFKSNLLLELRAGYTSARTTRSSESAGFDYTQVGFPAAMNSEIQTRQFPSINVAGLGLLGPYSGAPYDVNAEVRSASGTLSYMRGRHNLRFGAEWRAYLLDAFWGNGSGGTFAFNSAATQGPNPSASSATAGLGFASFMLGVPSSGTAVINAVPAFANIYYAGFVQDDFHVSRNLTLNLGLRYDYETPRTERFNRESFFDPTMINPIGQQVGLPSLRGGLEFVGVDGNPRGQADPDRGNFGPRFGFAYNPAPKTVIRGGYSILYLPNGTEQNFNTGMDGFSASTSQLAMNANFTPANPLSNPFPNGLVQPTGSSQGPLTLLGQSIYGFLRWMPVPYVQQFDFNVQRQLPGNVLAEAAYVGSRGVQIDIDTTLNQMPDRDLSLGSALTKSVPNPFYGIVTSGSLSTPTITANQLLRPFPQYNGVTYSYLPGGSSTYHSLQLRVERRLGNGLSVLGAYTWSKLISNTQGASVGPYAASPQDSNNLNEERSLSPVNVPQHFVVSAVYSFPFGPGKRWLGSAHGVRAKLSSGWQVAEIATYQTGQPVYVTTSVNNIGAFALSSRPNNNGHSAKLPNPTINEWFNTSVFSLPAPFTYGNVGRVLPDVTADSGKNLDLSLIKSTDIGEKLRLEFRAEAFNLLNTPQFMYPGTSMGTTTFGVVSAQLNNPRQIQMALRLVY